MQFWTIWKLMGIGLVGFEAALLTIVIIAASRQDEKMSGIALSLMVAAFFVIPVLAAIDLYRLGR